MYAKILAVGRKLRTYENLMNNYIQFKECYQKTFGNIPFGLSCCEETIVKSIAKYRAIYNNLLNQIK